MQFHESALGVEFFTKQFPALLGGLKDLSDALQKQNELLALSLVAKEKNNEILQTANSIIVSQMEQDVKMVEMDSTYFENIFGISFEPQVVLPEDFTPIPLNKSKKNKDGEDNDDGD